MDDTPQVEQVVLQVVQEIIGSRKLARVAGASELVRDLNICSDDLSMYLVPELERRLGIKVPVDEWSSVYTVDDVCLLLRRHLIRSS
jgi:acyl carrier protein